MALEGFSIGSQAPVTAPVPTGGSSALKGFSIGETKSKALPGFTATSTTPITTPTDIPVTALKAVDTSSLFSNFLRLVGKTASTITTGAKAVLNFLPDELAKTDYIKDIAHSPETSAGENILKSTASLVGGSSPENLPLGVGEVVKSSKEFLHNPQTPDVTFEDWLTGVNETSKNFIKQPISGATELPNIATAGQYQPQIKFTIPGLGEVTNSDYNIAQRVANGEDPNAVVPQEKANGFLNVLFLAGLISDVVNPRPTTVFKSELPENMGIKPKVPLQSFKFYPGDPIATQTITPQMTARLAQEKGINLTDIKGYNPDLPSYFKMTGSAGNKISIEVIQLKPSYLNSVFGKSNTPQSVPELLGASPKTPTSQEMMPVVEKAGPQNVTAIYSKTIDMAKVASMTNEAPKIPPTPSTPPIQAPSIHDTVAHNTLRLTNGDTTKAKEASIILKKEIKDAVQTHGEDVTVQTLQDKLGVDVTTANRLIQEAKLPTTVDEVKALAESEMEKVSPSTPEQKIIRSQPEFKGLDPDSFMLKADHTFDTSQIPKELQKYSTNVVQSSSGHPAILASIPLAKFGKPKFETLNQTEYKKGQQIKDPIEVTYKNGKYIITDGANRFTQARANGDRTIPAIVEFDKTKDNSSKRDVGQSYDNMPQAEKDYYLKEIQSVTSKTPLQEKIDDLITGKLKIRAGGKDLKTEKTEILGGHQGFIFRKNQNLDTLDSVASTVGVSSDQLLQAYMDRKAHLQAGFVNIGGAIEDTIKFGDKKIEDFIKKSLEPIKVSDNFQEGIQKLEGHAQADLESINKIITESKTTRADDEAVYHHAEDPTYKLSPKQEKLAKEDKIYAELNKELHQRIKKTGTPVDTDLYISRIVKGKPSPFQRIFDPLKGKKPTAGQGSILGKTTGSLKHRVMKVLIDEKGNRTVASIKNHSVDVADGKKTIHGKMVTAFKNKEATQLGTLKINTKEELMEKETKPVEREIKKIQDSITDIKSKIDGRQPVSEEKLATLGKEIDTLIKYVDNNVGALTAKELAPEIKQIQNKSIEFNALAEVKGSSDQAIANRTARLNTLQSQMVSLVNKLAEIEGKYNPDELNDRVFEADDGKKYTIGEATTKEIEQHTDLEYYHSALASRLLQYAKLRKIDRAIQFIESWKQSSDFKKIALPSDQIPPDGWRSTTSIYFKNYNFEPRTAEILDDMQKKIDSGQFNDAFTGINRVFVDAIFFDGFTHPINVATTWIFNRGVSGLYPPNVIKGFKAGARALEALSTKNEDYMTLLREGAHLMSSDVNNAKVADNIRKKLEIDLKNNPDLHQKIMNILGYAGKQLSFKTNIVYKISHNLAWLSNDFFTMQSIYETMDREGISLSDAIKETARFIPDYRQQTRLLDKPLTALLGQEMGGATARNLATKLIYNRNISMFGSYHVGLLQSFWNATKDSVAGEGIKGKAKGLDKLAMLALLIFVVYPWLDKMAQKATGNVNTYVTRSGVTKYPYLFYKILTGQTNAAAVATSIIPPNPGTQAGLELFFNRDFFTGNPVFGIGGEGIDNLVANKLAPLAEAKKIASGKGSGKDFGLSLFGVRTPANKQSALDLNSMIYNEKPNVLRDAKAHIAAGDTEGGAKLIEEFNQRLLDQIKKTDNGGNTTPERVQYFFNQYGLKMPGELAMSNYIAKQGKNIVQKVLPDGKPVIVKGTPIPATGVIGAIITYAKAISVSPLEAFQLIFSGQSIKQVTNGTIIVNRMSLSQSQAEKAALGGGNIPKGMTLDHRLSLELGGTNDASNLKLVPTAQAKIDDQVENYLGAALKNGGDKKTLQQMELDYKDGKITFDDIKKKI